MIFKIAWRNIWRNKRRTAIAAASILFAVFFAITINSLNRGMFDKMIDDSVSFYSGFGQVMQKGYWDDRTLDHSIEITEAFQNDLLAIEGIDAVVPRLESFALASYGKITKSSLVVGIDPTLEDQLTGLSKNLKEGAYLNADDNAVVISQGLAEKLKMTLNDTIVLISQGYRGVNAAGKYPIKGIVEFGSPALNMKMIYMPLKAAQWFYGADNLVTTAVLNIPDRKAAGTAITQLRKKLDGEQYELKSWDEMMPELMEMKDLKESSNFIMVLVLYLIVAFGIFGVILMMTKERQYEFGVLLSIGMKREQLALSTWIETILLGLLGAVMGVALAYGLMYYLAMNPIPITGEAAAATEKFGIEAVVIASLDGDLFYTEAITIFIITTILAIYPCWSIWTMKPVDAMRV